MRHTRGACSSLIRQPVPPGGEDLDAACRGAGGRVGAGLDEFDFRQATAAVWAIADEANR